MRHLHAVYRRMLNFDIEMKLYFDNLKCYHTVKYGQLYLNSCLDIIQSTLFLI